MASAASPIDAWKAVANSPTGLFYTFGVKGFISLPCFSTLLTVVLLLSDDFGLSDSHAGWIFGLHGGAVAFATLGAGYVIDTIGLRGAFTTACLLEVCACSILATTQSVNIAIFALCVLAPAALAIVIPCCKVAVLRFTDESVRHEAFGLLYVVQNIAVVLASLAITAGRFGGSVGGLSTWRSVQAINACSALIAALFGNMIMEPERVERDDRSRASTSMWQDAHFYRLMGLNTIFIFAHSMFRHMEATFPKYMHRTHGAETFYELFITINPVLVILCVPLVISEIRRRNSRTANVLLLGSCITASATVPFMYSSNVATAALFVALISIGEVIWSPKLIEYTLSLCPPGKEGVYSSLVTVPLFLSKVLVGGFSGHMLERECPSTGNCNGFGLWGTIFLTVCCTPLFLTIFRSSLFPNHALDKEESREKLDKEESRENYGSTSETPAAKGP